MCSIINDRKAQGKDTVRTSNGQAKLLAGKIANLSSLTLADSIEMEDLIVTELGGEDARRVRPPAAWRQAETSLQVRARQNCAQ